MASTVDGGTAADAVSVRLALEVIRDRIAAAGGDPRVVTIVAVTKGFGPEAVAAALAAGLDDVGENYAQELRAKAEGLAQSGTALRWHFVGRLQRNKVRSIADLVTLWQTVDRPELVDEIARRAPGAPVLVQVNVTGEPRKGGCRPADAGVLVRRAADAGLDARGLMTVASLGPPDEVRLAFRTVRDLADRLELPVRSMGMTDDLETAVEEGATMVRIGRALFGPRAP